MTEQLLNVSQVCAVLQQVGRKAVTQLVGADVLLYSGFDRVSFYDRVDAPGAQL